MGIGQLATGVGAGIGAFAVGAAGFGAITYNNLRNYDEQHDFQPKDVEPAELLYREIANPSQGRGPSVADRFRDNQWAPNVAAGVMLGGLGLALVGTQRASSAMMGAGIGIGLGAILGASLIGVAVHDKLHPRANKLADDRSNTVEAVRDNFMAESDPDGDGIATHFRSPGYEKCWIFYCEDRSNRGLAREALDRDGDGDITASDVEAALREADRNNDGRISKSDANRFAKDNWVDYWNFGRKP